MNPAGSCTVESMGDPELRERVAGRVDLADLEPYRAPQLDAPVKLNTNESPYPPPYEFVRELQERISTLDLNRYPERDATEVRQALASYAGTLSDRVWVANGSNEVILQLLMAFGGVDRKVVTFEPSYLMHSHFTKVTGTRHLRAGRNPDYSLHLESSLEVIESQGPDIVFVCSPNNPTGNSIPDIDVEKLCEATRGLVIVDEAYIEFANRRAGGEGAAQAGGRVPRDASLVLVEHFDNLAITRSFSKSWRLAGARIGYLIASPAIIDEIQKVRLPYHLSSLTQAAALAALGHAEQIKSTLDTIKHERDRVFRELTSMGAVMPYPSEANFLFFRCMDKRAEEVWQGLLDRGVLVRDFSSVPRCDDCLRVSIGTPEQNERFLDALSETAVNR